jgi:hypothetical protein
MPANVQVQTSLPDPSDHRKNLSIAPTNDRLLNASKACTRADSINANLCSSTSRTRASPGAAGCLYQAVASGSPFELSQPFECRQARHEHVFAAANYVEGFDAVHAAPDRLLGDRECRPLLLKVDLMVALLPSPMKLPSLIHSCCRNSRVAIALALMNRK